MTVQEISDFTTQTVGDTSSEMEAYAKSAIRLKYKTLYDAHAWRESFRLYSITLDPALNGVFFLPYDAEEIIFVSLSRDGVNFTRISYRERDWIERIGGSQHSLPGATPLYYRGENMAWPYIQPGKFTFTATSPSPFNVYIEGRDASNNPINESFNLNASVQPNPPGPDIIIPMSVITANSYQIVTSLSKDGGNLRIQDEVSTPLVLPEASNTLVFSQFVLFPPLVWNNPDGTPIPYSVRTQVKLKADTLDNDMSVPRISHIWDALIEFTMSSLYKKSRQITKAQAAEQSAMQHVQAAINVEKNQSENRQQVIPVIYDSGDYLNYGYKLVTSATPFG
jgi:hypothetical protein